MPSHAKVVQPYRDKVPIFARNGIEGQLDKMLQPQVTLKSGGYVIINQTEALVAIDVNSGRSTKEHSIEDTALQTNLEAAEEVARQLRLRDLAGLIVIDFIDMEENRNNRAVEKKLKDCLKNDRARIQVGRISHFGLLEMSRQRIRASVLESTTQTCPHCGGAGHIRSESSVALLVIRAIEEYLLKDARNHIVVHTPASTALYILNHKRANLVDLEARFGPTITVEADDSVGGQHYAIVKGEPSTRVVIDTPSLADVEEEEEPFVEEEEDEEEVEQEVRGQATSSVETQQDGDREDGQSRKRRRRRRRRGGRDRDDQASDAQHVSEAASDLDNGTIAEEGDDGDERNTAESDDDGDRPRKRRRGRRGGRRNRRDQDAQAAVEGQVPNDDSAAADADAPQAPHEIAAAADFSAQKSVEETALPDPVADAVPAEAEEKKPRRSRRKPRKGEEEAAPVEAEAETAAEGSDAVPAEADAEAKPKRKRAPRRKKADVEAEQAPEAVAQSGPEPAPEPALVDADDTDDTPAAAEPAPAEPVVVSGDTEEPVEPEKRRGGWWQRRSIF